MSLHKATLERYAACVSDLKTPLELETWMSRSENADENRVFLLYVYRSTCPHCKAFVPIFTRLLSVLCFIVNRLDETKRLLHIAQVDKSVTLASPATSELAPTVPTLLSARSGGEWVRLPAGDLNRTPSRLLEFLADTWAIESLKPLTTRPHFASANEVSKARRAVLVDYLPDRDFPPTRALLTRSEKAPSQPAQQTHDAMWHFEKRHRDDAGGLVLVNRLFLPSDHTFALEINPDRAQEAPVIVNLERNEVQAKGADVIQHVRDAR